MTSLLGERAAQLRTAFDRRFADPPARAPGRRLDLLAIWAGTDRYAVRMDEVAGLATDRPVTPLPVAGPQLLGLAGFRGVIVPVFDLASLLGHRKPENPRWMLLTPPPAAVALTFNGVAGHVRVPADDLQGGRDVVRDGGELWPVLSIPSLLTSITEVGCASPQKER